MLGGQCSRNADADSSSVPKCNLMRSFSAKRDAKTASTSVSHPSLSCPVPFPVLFHISESLTTHFTPRRDFHHARSNGLCGNQDCSAGSIYEIDDLSDTNWQRFGSARPTLRYGAPHLHLISRPARAERDTNSSRSRFLAPPRMHRTGPRSRTPGRPPDPLPEPRRRGSRSLTARPR